MVTRRLRSSVFAFAAIVVLAACGGNEPRSGEPASGNEVTFELAGTRWALMALGDKAVTVSDGGREAFIMLNSVEASVVGYAGCNRISSTYKVHDAQLSFGEVIATRMFCEDMPTETALQAALEASAAWRISGSQLALLNANQQVLARFEARNL